MTKLQTEFTKYMEIALKCDAIDFYRSNRVKNKYESISIEDIDELKVSVSLNGGIDTYFFDELENNIENKSLKYAFSKLTKRQKEIFGLYIDGYKTKEIAEIVGVSETNVTVTVSTVKRKIKKLMEENRDE